jgi:excisionase family DNA binding protein
VEKSISPKGVRMKADTISVAEASRMLSVRLDYVYRLLWDATLDGTKDEGVWRVRRKSVQAYLKKRSGRRSMAEQETAAAKA